MSVAPALDMDELRADLDEAVAQNLRDPYEGTDQTVRFLVCSRPTMER